MTGLEIVVGWLAGYAWRKARRAAGRADAEVDRAIDAAMDRLHEMVDTRLGDDPALRRLASEAGQDLDTMTTSERTRQRVALALADAADDDPVFAQQLRDLVTQLRQAAAGTRIGAVVATHTGTAVATGGAVANTGVVIGDITTDGR